MDGGLVEKYNPAHHTDRENVIQDLAAGFLQLDEQKTQQQTFGHVASIYDTQACVLPPVDVVLWSHRPRKAAIQHDKLYALLNLADRTIPTVPDYTRPVEFVLCELAKALILRQPSPTFPLDHIAFSHCTKHTRPAKLPSWAPDWTTCRHDIQLLGNYDPCISSFCADDHILIPLPSLLQDLFAQNS